MTEFLIYDLKVAALLVAFYLFWQLLAARQTFHRLNRVVLLATMVLSLVLPLCVVTLHRTVEVSAPTMVEAPSNRPQPMETADGEKPMPGGFALVGEGTLSRALFMLYLAGAVMCLARTLYSIYRVRRLVGQCERHDAPELARMAGGRVTVAVAEGNVAPFSWMRTIIMNRADYAEGNPALLAHECGHIRNHHSVDVIFVDVLTALQWFNPVVWLLRQDLRTIHEYEADAAVVSQGFNRYQYLQLLVRKAAGCGGYSIANGINDSTLKKRVIMMLKNKTPKRGWMRLLYVVPVVALSLVATAKTVVEYRIKPNSENTNADEKSFLSFSPTLVNRAHPQLGGAYIITLPEELPEEVVKKVGSLASENTQVVNGRRNIAFYKATTTMMLNGKEFDEHSLPDVKHEDVVLVEDEQKADGQLVVNIVTDKKLNEANRSGNHGGKSVGKNNDVAQGDDPIINIPEHLPQFPGGEGKLMEFLMRNVKYPKEAIELGMQGRVIVQFVVEKDGSLSDLKVVKSIEPKGDASGKKETSAENVDAQGNPVQQSNDIVVNSYAKGEETATPTELLNQEALRVMKLMPKWSPAKHRGKVVRSRYALPIVFRLS